MIFQDPFGSLNPRRRVGSIIGDPFAMHGVAEGRERKRRVQELMELVGLNPEHYNRYPAEFSGGQRQRIGVARAIALRPRLIVCDEPVSALDVSIQAQVINLLDDLQDRLGLAYVFISHDLSVVRHVSDRVAVMYLGQIVETATAAQLYEQPRHPYTVALMSAVPGRRPGPRRPAPPDPARRRRPLAGRPAGGLPLPPALPQGAAALHGRGARAGSPGAGRRHPPGRLPLPGGRPRRAGPAMSTVPLEAVAVGCRRVGHRGTQPAAAGPGAVAPRRRRDDVGRRRSSC